MHTREMIATHPEVGASVNQALVDAIDQAHDCAQTCTSCADACLAEDMVVELRQCIRLNLDCADVCTAIATLGSRRTGSNEQVIRKLLEACIVACFLCANECERHAGRHQHCRICAESCRRCAEICEAARRSM